MSRLPIDSSARTAPASSCFFVDARCGHEDRAAREFETTAASVTRSSGGASMST